MSSSHSIVVGKIATAFGVKGWVKIVSFTDPVDNLITLRPWYIQGKTVEVSECKRHGALLVAKLIGCDDRDAALRLRGKEITITRDQLPALAPDTYYWNDLEGMQVFSVEGSLIGRISHLFEAGETDMMCIIDAKGKECLIPFVLETIVKKVDLENRTITIEWDIN